MFQATSTPQWPVPGLCFSLSLDVCWGRICNLKDWENYGPLSSFGEWMMMQIMKMNMKMMMMPTTKTRIFDDSG